MSATAFSIQTQTRTSRPPDRLEHEALGFAPGGLLIGGAFVAAASERTLAVEDPATGRVLGQVADAGVCDCLAALDAATGAQAAWGHSAPRERARILRRAG